MFGKLTSIIKFVGKTKWVHAPPRRGIVLLRHCGFCVNVQEITIMS